MLLLERARLVAGSERLHRIGDLDKRSWSTLMQNRSWSTKSAASTQTSRVKSSLPSSTTLSPTKSVFTNDPCDTYEVCISMRRPRDVVLPIFSLSLGGTLPRSVVRVLLESGTAVAALHFGP